MNYERRFKRLIHDLLELTETHLKEWDEADRGIFDIDELLDKVEANAEENSEPVTYPIPKKKKTNSLKNQPPSRKGISSE